MRKLIGLVLGATVLSLACAAELGDWKSFRAEYVIFSGPYLAERDAPTVTDRKLSIALEGKPAKEIFDSIGPDLRDSCSAEDGDRDRRKGGVQCTYRRKDGSYRCWVGVNLRTGSSYPTVGC